MLRVLVLVLVLWGAAVQFTHAEDYPDINGTWIMVGGKGSSAVITQNENAKTFTVTLSDGREQTGSFQNRSTLRVPFQKDTGCCTGELLGNHTIRWSNNTTWTKQ